MSWIIPLLLLVIIIMLWLIHDMIADVGRDVGRLIIVLEYVSKKKPY